MNLAVDISLIFVVLGFLCWQTFTIRSNSAKTYVKKKRFFVKKNTVGVYFVEDENGNIEKHDIN